VALRLFFALLVAAGGPEGTRNGSEDGKRVGLQRIVAEKLLKTYELVEKDEFDDALALVDGLAKRRKLGPADLAQIHRFRGYILVNKGLMKEAAQEFETSLAQNALDRNARQVMTYSMAQLYTQLGQHERALELIETWLQSEESPTADAYFLKAMILVQQKSFQAALEPAKTAIDTSPSPRESWLQLLVAIQSHLKDYPSVAETLERLVAMAPDKKQYWVQLAAVQSHLRRDARAAATLQLAHDAELLEEDRELRQLAGLMLQRELPLQCARVIDEAMSAGAVQRDAESYWLMSNCYIAAREFDRALAPLAKAADLAPDGELYMRLGQIHLQRERFEPALEALEKALAKSKPAELGSVQLLIGLAQLGAERFDAAERAFRAARHDEKTHRAAESYLKYLEEQRARREQRRLLQLTSHR
jgi:tetratricopeptide (TPR) repeat protein